MGDEAKGERLEAKGERREARGGGLDLDYATAWSYGVDETMTFLIPNWEGGASGYNVGEKSQLCQTMRDNGVPKRSAEQFCQQVHKKGCPPETPFS